MTGMVSATQPPPPQAVPVNQGASRGLAGFFMSGLLFAFLGAFLPVWRLHLSEDHVAVGNHFLSMNLGFLAAYFASRGFPAKRLEIPLAAACALACGALIYLAFLPPGLSSWWCLGGVFCLGVAAGVINNAVFQALPSLYRQDRVATVNLAGACFGAGAIVITALVAGTLGGYSISVVLLGAAVLPAAFAIFYAQSRIQGEAAPQISLRRAFADLRSPAAVILTVLLFFQFGNEWAVAGWLPIYLIQRLGISPASSLVMLCVYWLAIVAGRFIVFSMLPAVSRGKTLAACVLSAMFGCSILMATDNRFGAVIGILFVGGGFASIYPLLSERISEPFADVAPRFFNGVFAVALTGGLLAPWSLGLLVEEFGIRAVMVLPLLGTMMVFLLLVLIWAEAKFRDRTNAEAQ